MLSSRISIGSKQKSTFLNRPPIIPSWSAYIPVSRRKAGEASPTGTLTSVCSIQARMYFKSCLFFFLISSQTFLCYWICKRRWPHVPHAETKEAPWGTRQVVDLSPCRLFWRCNLIFDFINRAPSSGSTRRRSVWHSTTCTSEGSSTEIWNWTTCFWTRKDTSNWRTTACARCGLLPVSWRFMDGAKWVCFVVDSLCFCRRDWDRVTQQALSVVLPITSPQKSSEERITVRTY